MTNRENTQLSILVRMDDPLAVLAEVSAIVKSMWPEFDFTSLNNVFHDIVRLYNGEYPGYKASNTQYHDLQHTTDAFMAITRLMHGAFLHGHDPGPLAANLALIATLMHDTGYIQDTNDTKGTGARYTLNHVDRSIDFMREYFAANGFTENDFQDAGNILNCTGLNVNIREIRFGSDQVKMLGKMLGTADLLGQMADRTYLEKLLYLYSEFKEAGIAGYETELELLEKTIGFYNLTQKRLDEDLGRVWQFLPAHFNAWYGLDTDLYAEAISKNIQYLEHLLTYKREDYRSCLRRSGVVKKLESEGK